MQLKPDVVAPGNKIVSLEAAGSYLAKTYPALRVAGSGTNAFRQMSGTSMAAAMVSGGAALLLESSPSLTVRQLKVALQVTAAPKPSEGLIAAGTGSVNLYAARKFAAPQQLLGLIPTTTISGQLVSGGGLTYLATGAIVDMSNAGLAGLRVFGLIDVRKQPYNVSRTSTAGPDRLGRHEHLDLRSADRLGRSVDDPRRLPDRLGRSDLQPLRAADCLGRSTLHAERPADRLGRPDRLGRSNRLGRQHSSRAMTTRFRPAAIDWYVGTIVLAGAVVIGWSALGLPSTPHAREWGVLAGIALMASRFPLRVPGRSAWFSISDTFFMTSALLFGPGPATITIAVDSMLMTHAFKTFSSAASCSMAARPRSRSGPARKCFSGCPALRRCLASACRSTA